MTNEAHGEGRSIAIIGGGIAGLCAGCYAQMNGYSAKIFEMHSIPGGVCTAWNRSGYTIDSCIHWLGGSAPGLNYHQLWKEVGAVQGRTMVDLDEYLRIEGADGRALVLYCDVDRLERHMLELAPEDAATIRAFTGAIRKFARFDLPVDKAPELYGTRDKLGVAWGMLPYARQLMKWQKVSVSEFAKRLVNPFLRDAFASAAADAPEFPMLALIMPLAWLHRKTAGYPLGGSLPFARAIEKRFLDLGGSIEYSARVSKILVEPDPSGPCDRAVGVRLEDGSEHRAETVVSAADGRTTIFDMLDGRYLSDTIRGYYDNMPLFPPLLYVGLGIADPLTKVPSTISGITFPLDPPISIDGRERTRLTMKAYNFDPSLAPAGKTTLIVSINSDYNRWVELKTDPERYRAEKERAVAGVIEALEQRIPGIGGKVEMRDVATPVTWERYTGNWRGSYEGWLPSGKTMMMQMSKTLPGLGSFYMIGQWTTPGGGLPPAVSSGRHVVQLLCRKDGRRFVATEP